MVAEDRIDELEARVAALEHAARPPIAPKRLVAPPPGVTEVPVHRAPVARVAKPAAPKRDLEDFLGGSVLAWLGGVAVLAGLAFLLTIAISSGWIGEGARTALAGALSLGLLATGVWLRERPGHYEAALVAAAVGVAGTFATLFVAGPVYDLLPRDAALLGALLTGGLAAALSIRWHAQVMGWLGLLGALWAPGVLGAGDGTEHLFLLIAYAAAVAVLVWRRWTVLAGFAFFSALAQWVGWFADGDELLSLVTFGLLAAALAFGLEANRRGLRRVKIGPRARTRPSWFAASVLVIDAAVLALAGWFALDGELWLTALAVAHVGLGLAATRRPRISRELALITIAIGVVLANLAFASVASGLPLVIGWGLSALPFAALLGARRLGHSSRIADLILGRPERADRVLALAGLAGQVSLALFQGLLFDARPTELAGPLASDGALAAAGALALVAWSCGRLAGPRWRTALDLLALAAVAHFTGLALEGVALTVALAGQALALAALARGNSDRVTGWAAVAFALTALLHALTTIAPPDALLDGLADPLAAAGALIAVAGAAWAVSRVPLGDEWMREFLLGGAAIVLLYLASIEVVTLAGGGQDGQTALSVLWAVAGVGALVGGLLLDDRRLRRGALALLAVTVAKVFLYDLSSLTSLYRVGSLIGLGLLLLCGAFAWQKVRPSGTPAR